MKKILVLLATPLLLLSLTSSCTQTNFTNRSIDQLLADYVQAIQTRDTTMLAECFHSSVFPLFQTTRQAFANQIFADLTKMGQEFDVRFELTSYQLERKWFTLEGLQYLTKPVVWRTTYRVKSHDTTSLASLKKLADVYRSSLQGVLDLQRETYQIPKEVDMVSLNEEEGELTILQGETNQMVYERSQKEWRLVPMTYSFMRTMNKTDTSKTVSNRAAHSPAGTQR